MYNTVNLVFLSFILSSVTSEEPVVDTSHGKIQGKILKTFFKNVEYYGFLGIPYATPPLKDLRFLPPRPVDPWNRTLAATKEKQACIQFNNNVRKGQPLGHYGTEDCLYLEIFTPKTDNKMRTVIVFLYNEHFTGSYNKTKDYSPDFFIEEDVVVVTLSHRLSSIGFLSLDDETVPGNSGLKDIVAALEWINKNVDKFGGDPNKVTLMGSEGGAVAVDLLIHSNAKKLFRFAIMQGGTSWSSGYLQENVRERAFKLGKLVERTTSSSSLLLKDLRDIPASDLVNIEVHASPSDYFKENQRSILSFGPIVEKQPNGLIAQYPEDSLERINIPIMIGFNSREGLEPSLQYLIEPRYLSYVQKDFPFLIPIRVKFKFDPLHDSFFEAIEEIKKYYYKKGKVTMKSITDHITYLGDSLIGYAVDYAVRKYANKSSKPLYYYYFDYFSDLNENKNNIMKHSTIEDGTWGAASGDELCYLFYCPALKKIYLKHEKDASEEIILQKKMTKMWTNFAKYGNPTPEANIDLEDLKWPPYSTETKQYLHIHRQLQVKSDLLKNNFEFWQSFIRNWEQRAINGTIFSQRNKKEEL